MYMNMYIIPKTLVAVAPRALHDEDVQAAGSAKAGKAVPFRRACGAEQRAVLEFGGLHTGVEALR